MPRLDKLYMTTDFDTLKNDGRETASIVIPAGDIIPASSTREYMTNIEIGSPESILLVQTRNDAGDFDDENWLQLQTPFAFSRTGSLGGYSVVALYYHTGGNTVRVGCIVSNPYTSDMTLHAVTEAWSFVVRSIKPPRFE